MSAGGPSTWEISPIFKGIGYSSAVMVFYGNIFYIVLLAYSLYYMIMSFNSILPWASCENTWNTANCITPYEHFLSSQLNISNSSMLATKSSADEFWELNVLRRTGSFDEIGGIRWPLFICLAISWILVFFCIFKGIKWTGKVNCCLNDF